ncbi:unnamed protein product, partial [Mesorhabditis belari]|uniref:Uncharacterized protein n=1 Tax=Mesorhabditis belari TaxID=2138241 RepID=A0AAF3F3J9_9BILA
MKTYRWFILFYQVFFTDPNRIP